MAVVGIPILIFSEYIVYASLLALLALFALYEMFKVVGIEKYLIITIPPYLMGVGFPIAAYFISRDNATKFILIGVASLFAYLLYTYFVAVFMKGKIKFEEISQAFLLSCYVIFSFSSISAMRYLDESVGLWFVVLMLVCAWGCDVFAYFTGRFFGRHKLIPEISPKKTVEGSIGGIVCAGGLAMLLGLIVSLTTDLTPDYLVLALCGVVLSAVSQIGDLIASLLKREHGVKDYGKIFPGHGGVMDRFDSILSISTVLMAVCLVFPPFA